MTKNITANSTCLAENVSHVITDRDRNSRKIPFLSPKQMQNPLCQSVISQGRGMTEDEVIPWPARSPDLKPLDFFFWGSLKDKIYNSK